jgi:hypothetical protein
MILEKIAKNGGEAYVTCVSPIFDPFHLGVSRTILFYRLPGVGPSRATLITHKGVVGCLSLKVVEGGF